MKTTLILMSVIAFLISFIGLTLSYYRAKTKKLNAKIESLETKNQKQQENIIALCQFAEEQQKIKADSQKVKNEITEAKTDEEINEVIARLIRNNNDRLRLSVKS